MMDLEWSAILKLVPIQGLRLLSVLIKFSKLKKTFLIIHTSNKYED